MSSVAFATRRLWLRRWLAVWPLLSLPLKLAVLPFKLLWLPVRLARFVRAAWRTNRGDVIGGGIAISMITLLIGGCTWNVISQELGREPATAEEIQAARKADSCVDHTLVLRAKGWNRPVLREDVKRTKSDCAAYWANERAKEAQAKALK